MYVLYLRAKSEGYYIVGYIEGYYIVHKIKNRQIDYKFNFLTNSDVHQYNTRRKNDFHLKRVKTNWGKQTFSYLALNDFNTLPSVIKDTNSLDTFKFYFKHQN